jgi:hypothetical protein
VDASWESYFDKMTGSLVAVTGEGTMWVPNGGGYCIDCKGGPADFVPVVGCSGPRDLCARADGGTDGACPAPPVLDCTQAVPEAGACPGWPQLFGGGPSDASYPVGCTATVPACNAFANEAGTCLCFPAGSVYTGSADPGCVELRALSRRYARDSTSAMSAASPDGSTNSAPVAFARARSRRIRSRASFKGSSLMGVTTTRLAAPVSRLGASAKPLPARVWPLDGSTRPLAARVWPLGASTTRLAVHVSPLGRFVAPRGQSTKPFALPLGLAHERLGLTGSPLELADKRLGLTDSPLGLADEPLRRTGWLVQRADEGLGLTDSPLGLADER